MDRAEIDGASPGQGDPDEYSFTLTKAGIEGTMAAVFEVEHSGQGKLRKE
jgi:hypothetical protein